MTAAPGVLIEGLGDLGAVRPSRRSLPAGNDLRLLSAASSAGSVTAIRHRGIETFASSSRHHRQHQGLRQSRAVVSEPFLEQQPSPASLPMPDRTSTCPQEQARCRLARCLIASVSDCVRNFGRPGSRPHEVAKVPRVRARRASRWPVCRAQNCKQGSGGRAAGLATPELGLWRRDRQNPPMRPLGRNMGAVPTPGGYSYKCSKSIFAQADTQAAQKRTRTSWRQRPSNPRACNATFLRGAFTALPEPATWSIRLRPALSRLRSTKLRRTGEREARAGLTEAVVQPREAKPNVVR